MDELPPELEQAVNDMSGQIDRATTALQDDPGTVDLWHDAMLVLIARYMLAAYYVGQKSPELTPAQRSEVTGLVSEQAKYLDAFKQEIEQGEWKADYNARARMYAGSVKEAYWRGATQGLNLPAYPGDGSSECLTNCGCQWRTTDRGAYWVRGKADSCPTCLSREANWNPYEVNA